MTDNSRQQLKINDTVWQVELLLPMPRMNMTTGFTFSYHHCYDFTWLLCLWQKQIRQRPTIKLIFDNPSPPPSPPSPPPSPTSSSFSSFSSSDPLFHLILLLHLHLLQLMTMYTCTLMSEYVFAEENSCFQGLTRVKLCFSGWEEKSSKSEGCLFTSQWRKEGRVQVLQTKQE